MRNTPNRVVFFLCLCAVAFPAFARNPQNSSPQFVSANEKSERLTLPEKSSIFSIELSLSSGTPQLATLFAKIVAPNGVSLAEASTPFEPSSSPVRVEVPLKWFPLNELEEEQTRISGRDGLFGAAVGAFHDAFDGVRDMCQKIWIDDELGFDGAGE
jgi:hypothetical protein